MNVILIFRQVPLVFASIYVSSGVLICTPVQLRTIRHAVSQSHGSDFLIHIINRIVVDAIFLCYKLQIIKKKKMGHTFK